jgi:phosphatidylserine/phosphatidylglycerophosphate/cardiolipin synthase-like enzyme
LIISFGIVWAVTGKLPILTPPSTSDTFTTPKDIIVDIPLKPSSYPAEVIVLPNDGKRAIIKLLESAVESIWICCYMLSDEDIIDSLCGARKCGVDVRVMLEGQPYGNKTINYSTAKKLIEANIEFSWSNPKFALTHAKYIIIDHRKLLLMTFNLCESVFLNNREYGVLIHDLKAVKEMEAIFNVDWQRKEYIPVSSSLILSPENARKRLIKLINSAKKKIWVQMLVMEDEEIMDALIEAKTRGVKIRVLLAEPKKIETNATAEKYLKKHKILVKFQHKPFLHAKMMLFDNKVAFVGSQNITVQSLDDNREVGIIIKYPKAVRRLKWMFFKDWRKGY